MEAVVKFLIVFLGFIGLVALLATLGAYPTKWVVNYLFSPSALLAVFGTAKIGFWQALALNFITGLIRGVVTTKGK